MRGIVVVLLLGIGFIGLFCKGVRLQLEQSERAMERYLQRQVWSPVSKPRRMHLPFPSIGAAIPVEPDVGVAATYSKYV